MLHSPVRELKTSGAAERKDSEEYPVKELVGTAATLRKAGQIFILAKIWICRVSPWLGKGCLMTKSAIKEHRKKTGGEQQEEDFESRKNMLEGVNTDYG